MIKITIEAETGHEARAQLEALLQASQAEPAIPAPASQPEPAIPAPASQTEPAIPAPASQTEPATPERDAEGLPWDPRIHSRGRTLLKNRCWKKKRDLDPATYEAVKAELLGQPAASDVPPPPPPASDLTYVGLIQKATAAAVTPDKMEAACKAVGLSNTAELAAKTEHLGAVARELNLA